MGAQLWLEQEMKLYVSGSSFHLIVNPSFMTANSTIVYPTSADILLLLFEILISNKKVFIFLDFLSSIYVVSFSIECNW